MIRIEKDMKYGLTLGFEVEGFFTENARFQLEAMGFEETDDPSIHWDMEDDEVYYKAEYRSPIYYGLARLNNDLQVIHRLFAREDIVTNDSCGLHIHLGAPENILRLFIDREYPEYLAEHFRQYHWFAERVNGNYNGDSWCALDYEEQYWRMRFGIDDNFTRYKIVNYRALNSHGTIECRLFPPYDYKHLIIEYLNVAIEWIKMKKKTEEWTERVTIGELKNNVEVINYV